jgi:hypothetical protein
MTNPQPKRRQSGVETVTSARDIRPKPTSSNGSPHPFSSLPGQSAVPTKKRGRPSKADVEERQREAILRGEVLPPPKAITPKGGKQAVTGEPSSAGYAAIAPMGSAPAPELSGGVQCGPIEAASAPATMVPAGDSPGKKKRARAAPRQPKVGKLQEWESKETNRLSRFLNLVKAVFLLQLHNLLNHSQWRRHKFRRQSLLVNLSTNIDQRTQVHR